MGDFGVDTAQDRDERKPIYTKRSSTDFGDHEIHLQLTIILRKGQTKSKQTNNQQQQQNTPEKKSKTKIHKNQHKNKTTTIKKSQPKTLNKPTHKGN